MEHRERSRKGRPDRDTVSSTSLKKEVAGTVNTAVVNYRHIKDCSCTEHKTTVTERRLDSQQIHASPKIQVNLEFVETLKVKTFPYSGSEFQRNIISEQNPCPSTRSLRETQRNGTSFEGDRDFDFLKTPPLPRSSSLKSKKSPSGTPTERKSVRFADALGLDLALVRHILNPDEPPTVPSNRVQYLPPDFLDHPVAVSYWRVTFPQTITSENLIQRIREQKVVLENCFVNNSTRKVYGVVRVANISYEKEVWVRYSTNGWLTHTDARASYVEHSNDLATDRFSFALAIPDQLGARSRLEFALMFSAGSTTFWDNNRGGNYALQCVETYHEL